MKLVALVLIIASLSACSRGLNRPDAPDDLIERDSMVVVMRELVVLESYLQNRYQHVNNYYKVMTLSGKKCLQKYHFTPDRFERSYDYYASRQEEMQSIYTEVMDSLTKEVNELTISHGKQDDTVNVAPILP